MLVCYGCRFYFDSLDLRVRPSAVCFKLLMNLCVICIIYRHSIGIIFIVNKNTFKTFQTLIVCLNVNSFITRQ